MYHDVPDVKDYGEAIDRTERKLAEARAKRDNAMAAVEADRRGVQKLSKSDYSDQKAIYGNAQADVERYQAYLRMYQGCHLGVLSSGWIREQFDMQARKVSLAQVWQRWRDVLAARQVLADLCVKVPQAERNYFEDDFGSDKFDIYVGTMRERVEAKAAVDRAAGLYDIVLRAYDGRVHRTHDQTLDINNLVRPPKRPPPSGTKSRKTSSVTRSTFIGA
jgi:hypothetical protein